MTSRPSRPSPIRTCVLALALAPVAAGGAEWSTQTSAQLSALAQTNPQLLAGEQHDARGGVGDFGLHLLRQTGLFDADLNARASVYRYGGDTNLDRDEQQLALALVRRGELYVLRGNVSASRDTTLTSELGTTGATAYNLRHTGRAASVAPLWQLTERFTTGLTVGWQDSNYANSGPSGLSGYNYAYAGFNAGFDVSEATNTALTISRGRLDSDAYAFDTNNVDMSLQIQHVWSQRWQGSISGGPSWVRTGGRRSAGSVFSAALARSGERLTIDASLARSTSPTGSGLLSRREDAGLRASLALSPYLSVSASGTLIRSKELVPQLGARISDVRYTHGEMSLYWRFMEELSLGVGTGYSAQKVPGIGTAGHNFDARLTLEWRRSGHIG